MTEIEDNLDEDEALIRRVKASCEATIRVCDRADGVVKKGAFCDIKAEFQDMLRVCEIAGQAMYLGFYVPAYLPARRGDAGPSRRAADVFAEASTLYRDVPHVVKDGPKRRVSTTDREAYLRSVRKRPKDPAGRKLYMRAYMRDYKRKWRAKQRAAK
jgi:hypothetical protein